jgi:anti-sigma factor RsiW
MSAGMPITDDDLHAFADGALTNERAAEVEQHLTATPADAARVAFYRRLNNDLHAQFDPVLGESIPPRLLATPYVRRRAWALQAVAAAVLLAVGLGAGWFANEYTTAQEQPVVAFAEQAAEAHLIYVAEGRHAVEVPAADGEHLQKWLSNRLQNNVTIPDLRKVGYEFLGGRLLPAGKGLAAQFMYENNGGNRVTLYFAPGGAANTAFRYVQTDGLSMYYWRDAHFTYALSSELPRETLEQICEAVYGQINPGAPAEEW